MSVRSIASLRTSEALLSIMVLVTAVAAFLPTSVNPEVDETSEWRTVTVDSAGNIGLWTSLALDSNDYPHIGYYDFANRDLKYAKWTGSNWSIETVDSIGNIGDFTSLALDGNDHPHISYYDGQNADLKYAKWTGSNWSIETVDSIGSVGAHTSLALDAMGRPQISYTGGQNGPDYSLKYARWTGTNWSIEVVEFAQITSTSIALDGGGNPHISYADWSNHALKYARWTGGNWSIEVIDPVYSLGLSGVDMVVDSGGTPYVIYYDGGFSTLKFATRTNGNWSIEPVDPSHHDGPYDSIALDSKGNPHIAYGEASGGPVRYARRIGANWSIESWESPDEFDMYTSIAMDSNDVPHISYHNFTGGSLKYATKVDLKPVNNPPIAVAGGPYVGHEGTPRPFDASASSDPDNDSLLYRWDFDNDGIADTSWSSSPTATNTWSDDYTGEVRVEVSDGNLTSNATATVTILNLPPSIDSITATVNVNATLRIAGEKWHDVSAFVVDGGNESLVASLVRKPGKPQETSFEVSIDMTRNNSFRIAYSPDDDPVNGQPNGATPAWLTFTFGSGSPVDIRHTFNARHPDTWNWTVGLNSLMAGRDITFTATATDPGSDDLTFTWEWGDGSPATAMMYYNDGIGPDPYPSPDGTFPFTVTDSHVHQYSSAGRFDLKLTVRDDDGGMIESLVVIMIAG